MSDRGVIRASYIGWADGEEDAMKRLGVVRAAALSGLSCCLPLGGCAGDGGRASSVGVIEAYVDAFNARDPEAIGALATDDVAWHFVSGDALATESRGRASLVDGMRGYFASFSTARAELEFVRAGGSFAVGRERVTWSGPEGEERSRASLAVYELEGGLLKNVWYFPSEP